MLSFLKEFVYFSPSNFNPLKRFTIHLANILNIIIKNCYFLGTNDSSLVIQVRTTIVGDANATGFTGVAIKEGNGETIQVNLNSTGMHVLYFRTKILH